jgi:hypothetical protein
MNTIIIDKILIHMFDMEHSKLICSDRFINLTEGTTEYYDKKIEKVITSSMKKELVVGEHHHLLELANNMLVDNDSFRKEAKQISEDLFSLCRKIDEMPNANIMYVECKVDGVKHIIVIKLNFKITPVSVIEEVDGERQIKFMNQQILPPKSTNVDEAIVINMEDNIISLIEKRFTIDGKPGYYLNEQYIKGEPKLTDKQKLSIVNKVVKKVDGEFNVVEGDPLPLVKKELVELVMDHKPVKPMELAKKVMQNDYNASEEVELIMKDLGIVEDDEIYNVPGNMDRMARCKLVLDEDRIIELDVEDYINNRDITKESNADGTSKIIISNIRDIVVK